MLSSSELERYARHIVLREVGGPGQAALKEASVLVIGAGGLGAPALMYLAAAGVGTLGVVDDDVVSLSNLQRQIIHDTYDVDKPKVDSAAERISRLNPHVQFAAHATRLNAGNAMELIGGYDLVLDGSDNFETRYLVSDACFLAAKPLITAALGMFDGSLTTIRAHEKNADGLFNPTYRCLFPEPPPPGTVPACAEAGVMGALAGILGSMMALEAIREIVGFGEGLVGRLLIVDARAMRFETLRYQRDPLNPLEIDQLRDAMLDPDQRLKLYVQFSRDRMTKLEQMRSNPKTTERGRQTHDMLEDFLALYDELNDNIDMYVGRKDDIRKPLKVIIEADTEFQSKLRALKDSANANATEATQYEFLLTDALDTVDSSAEDHRKTVAEVEEYVKKKKKSK